MACFQSWREQSGVDDVSLVEYVSGVYLFGDHDRCSGDVIFSEEVSNDRMSQSGQ
jgi:hypothetical protein